MSEGIMKFGATGALGGLCAQGVLEDSLTHRGEATQPPIAGSTVGISQNLTEQPSEVFCGRRMDDLVSGHTTHHIY